MTTTPGREGTLASRRTQGKGGLRFLFEEIDQIMSDS